MIIEYDLEHSLQFTITIRIFVTYTGERSVYDVTRVVYVKVGWTLVGLKAEHRSNSGKLLPWRFNALQPQTFESAECVLYHTWSHGQSVTRASAFRVSVIRTTIAGSIK